MSKLTDEETKTVDAYEKHGSVWVRNNDKKYFWLKYMKMLQRYAPTGRILDIGCGGGRDAEELVELGYDYTGVDITDKLLEIARKRLPKQKFYKQSVYDLKFDDKFDVFWAVAVLLHVPKNRIDEALQSIKSILKTGAYGCITVKDGSGEGLRTDTLEDTELERFFSYWPREDFAKVLDRNGFGIAEYDYWPVNAKTRWHCYIVKAQ